MLIGDPNDVAGGNMNYLTADELLQDRLCGIVEPVEVRDARGKVLGYFTPLVSPEDKAKYARLAELFDRQEAERLAATEHEGFTIDQVREHLGASDQPK
jgi:hypothetical protein